MKKIPAWLHALPWCLAACAARADTVVVFNEIMYRPDSAGEAAGEWVELQNQMGVDVDISGWRLNDAVNFNFPAGTVIKAGAYLVVAENPAALTAAGVTGVLGPWSGKLSDNGETLELRNNSDRVMDEVEYNDRGAWPAAAVGGGPSLARRARFLPGSAAASWVASAKTGGTPGAENFPAGTASPAGLVLNEVAAARVEIMNTGAETVNTAGYVLRVTDGPSVTLPDQVLPPGGFLTVDLAAAAEHPVTLFAADGVTCLDSLVIRDRVRARFPDGSGAWYYAAAETPNAANQVTLHNEIVLNEIMYDPPDDSLNPEDASRPGQWLEFYNKSSAPLDLAGWSLDGGITFVFPAGAKLAPGGYCVVAEKPAVFSAAHPLPAGAVFGPWTRTLSGRSDTVTLKDPAGNPADEVTYFSEGRWPWQANGGGSSLELRSPDADNNVPESWAASDETGKAAWRTFTWSGMNKPSQTGEPTLWRELNLLLVDGPGECLIDDVKVTDTTTGNDLIQNGAFTDGDAHWRLLGTHRHSRVEPEPGNSGNNVLHLVATGAGEYQGNQIETTFLNNQALVSNRVYEISLRARWLSGGGRLNTRLYFNRLPRTNVLGAVTNGGTPGAPNSRAVPAAGPVFRRLSHTPVVPAANQPVTVSVAASDPQGVGSLVLKYAVGASADWQTAPMTEEGGVFTGVIPGQPSGVVRFYVEGTDSAGAVSVFPAGGPDARAMCKVQDNLATGSMTKLRVVMLPADVTFLHRDVNTLSNEYLPCTVIADEKDVYYDAGIRLKGSFVGRNVARVGFSLRFQSDKPFRGLYDKIAVDRSQHAALGQGEIIVKHIAGAAGGIPNMYDDLARFIHPLATYTGKCQLRLTGFEDEYLDTQFENGSEGAMFEMEVIRWNLATVDGKPESLKRPGNEGSGTGYQNYDLADYGTDQEAYRWVFLQSNNRSRDDYTGLVPLIRMFSKSGVAFDTEANLRLDKESWLRTLAFQSLVGTADAAYTATNIHNLRLYIRPQDGLAYYMPWDWDSAFMNASNSSVVGSGNIAKVVTSTPDNRRRYYWQLNDLVKNVFNSAYMTKWTQHYGTVAGESYSGILSFINSRGAFVRTQVPSTTAFASTAGIVNNQGVLTLTGTANINVLNIEVNGILYEPVWTSNTAWKINVPLETGSNNLAIRGLDKNGEEVAGAVSTQTVENTTGSSWAELRINEFMAENTASAADPADGDHEDWLELHNPGDTAVDLSGWRLSDSAAGADPFVIPDGWSIPAKGFLLMWADGEPSQNPETPSSKSALHVGFRLEKEGESILLSAPDGRVMDRVTFGLQTADQSFGRFREGSAELTALTLPTPGEPNVCARITRAALGAGVASSELDVTTTPGWSYGVESSPDLQTWTAAPPPVAAAGLSLTLPVPAAPANRWLRVRVSKP